jgi:GH18 family chitinase
MTCDENAPGLDLASVTFLPGGRSAKRNDRDTMSMGRVVQLCVLSLAIGVSARAGDGAPPPPAAFRIVGYLPEYRAAEFDLAAARSLTDLVVFSAEPTAAGKLDLTRLKKVPWAKLRAFKTRERVRLILCAGGWERSAHFAAAAGSPDRRREFVQAAVQVCLDERLDGIDLDWEHPKGAAEQDAYGALLAELHTGFQPHGLLLSVTVAPWQKLPGKAFAAVDWVQVMAYDHEGRHSTFEAAREDVEALLGAGVPAEKVVLGLPFYGRDVKKQGRALSYREIVAGHDLKADVDEIDGVYFNGLATTRRKTGFALQSRLGGVMVWELGQDAPGDRSLLTVIRRLVDQSR